MAKMRTGLTAKIAQKAKEIVGSEKNGVGYNDLVNRLLTEFNTEVHNINNGIDILKKDPDIIRPRRGLYLHKQFLEDQQVSREIAQPEHTAVGEEEYYEPIMKFLKEYNEITIGICPPETSRDKWLNPDIIGLNEPLRHAVYRFQPEIVSVEVKPDTNQLYIGFAQACSYLLFSHKVFLAIPRDTDEDSRDRIESTCKIVGIGLIYFDKNEKNPNPEIKIPPKKSEPDYYFINNSSKKISELIKSITNEPNGN